MPQALKAGANSVLRKPLLVNQVRDTLATARDLLKAKKESAGQATPAATAVAGLPGKVFRPLVSNAGEKSLRAGEFIQSTTAAPGAQFVTESETRPESFDQMAATQVDPVKDLEPMAAAVEDQPATPEPPAPSQETRGLAWYLKARAGKLPAPAPAPLSVPVPTRPELISYDQITVEKDEPRGNSLEVGAANASLVKPQRRIQHDPNQDDLQAEQPHEKQTEAELFAYIEEGSNGNSDQDLPKARPGLRRLAFVAGLVAVCTVGAVMPQAPWHKNAQTLWRQLHRTAQSWLNPQPVTPAQAPVSHENFGQAEDEYKLPVAENIPDATTDPTQIRVLPVVDPTVKQPNANASNPGQAVAVDPAQTTGTQSPEAHTDETQPAQPVAANNSPGQVPTSKGVDEPQPESTVPPAVAPPVQPVPQKSPAPHYVPASTSPNNSAIPSSLKSQMASMTPDASGNKPVEAAMPSIEPVNLPEATARGLLIDQPPAAYPETAKGQQGTVVLQVLIGRDGTVQDAKFMQGSLAFARAAIDAVRQWKFKPYMMNNRATSTQTQLTISFKPAS